jgi:hypothetical protein
MASDVRRLGNAGSSEHAQVDRKRGSFVHVAPRWQRAGSPSTWIGQRVAYCFLKQALLLSSQHGRHQAAVLATALADAHARITVSADAAVPDVRTLMSWANSKKRVQHSIAASVEPVLVLTNGHGLGLPSRGSRFLDALMSSPIDYSHLATIAGSWSRHLASLDVAARLDQPEGERLSIAQRLLTSAAHAWSPLAEQDQSQRLRFNIAVTRDVAVQYIPDSPWSVLQYLLALATRSDQLDASLHGPLSLDLAAARWATSVLLDEGHRSWPGRWHVIEASDVVRNLLLVGAGGRGLLQAVTLTERGYPWAAFDAAYKLRSNFARLKRAYGRTLTAYGVRTTSLDETVLPADLARMRADMAKWPTIIGRSSRTH